LGVHRVDGDDRTGQARERCQKVPDRGNLVRFRGHRDLSENRAGAVRQRRDQMRRFTVLIAGATDGLTVDRDHPPARDQRGPGP
jgi:hypothetical protein